MAKLEGVRPFEVENGEVTAVLYNGMEYVRIFEQPQAGDVMFANSGGRDVTEGEYYEITGVDEEGDPVFIDDADEINGVDLKYPHEPPNIYYRR